MQKDDSAFQQGMKPFVYSEKKNKANNTNEWSRGGFDIRYYKNQFKTTDRDCAPDYDWDHDMIPCYEFDSEESKKIGLNTLSFSYVFEYDHDTVYFSYFQPYTLTDLQDMMFMLKGKYPEEHLNSILKIQKLCDSIAGNPCYLLTITSDVKKHDVSININSQSQRKQGLEKRISKLANSALGNQTNENSNDLVQADRDKNNEECWLFRDPNQAGNKKQIIFLQSRVHPGESNSQFMIQGCIEFLLQQHDTDAKLLRDTFIFKIVPMLNPDGVVIGNYRCNLGGADLNRRWPNPSRFLHPTIYYAKKLIAAYHRDNQVVLFCDMHGHSRKRNVFMYGCVSAQTDINQHKNNNLIKVLPYFLAQKNKLFSFNDCKFANEKDKETTARLVMFRQFNIINSYTLESTFYAVCNQKNQYLSSQKRKPTEEDQQLKPFELNLVGKDFCQTIIAMIHSKILKKKFTVETSYHHIYQLNSKALKKQMTFQTKDLMQTTQTLNQGSASAGLPNQSEKRNDEKAEEDFLQAQIAAEQAQNTANERDGGKIKRPKNVNLMQGQFQSILNATTQIISTKTAIKALDKKDDEFFDEFINSERTTDFQTHTAKDPEQAPTNLYLSYLNGTGTVTRNPSNLEQFRQIKNKSSNKLSSTKQSQTNIDQSFQLIRTPLPGELTTAQNLTQLKKVKNKTDSLKAEGKPPSNPSKKQSLIKQEKDVISSAKINRNKETNSPAKPKKEKEHKDKNEISKSNKKTSKKIKKKDGHEISSNQPNSVSIKDNQIFEAVRSDNVTDPLVLKREDIALTTASNLGNQSELISLKRRSNFEDWADAAEPLFDDEDQKKEPLQYERVASRGEDEFFTAADLNQYIQAPTSLSRTFEQFSRYDDDSQSKLHRLDSQRRLTEVKKTSQQPEVPLMSNLIIAMALKRQNSKFNDSPDIKKMKLHEYNQPFDVNYLRIQDDNNTQRSYGLGTRQGSVNLHEVRQVAREKQHQFFNGDMDSSYSPNLPQVEGFLQPYYKRRVRFQEFQNDLSDGQYQDPLGYSGTALKQGSPRCGAFPEDQPLYSIQKNLNPVVHLSHIQQSHNQKSLNRKIVGNSLKAGGKLRMSSEIGIREVNQENFSAQPFNQQKHFSQKAVGNQPISVNQHMARHATEVYQTQQDVARDYSWYQTKKTNQNTIQSFTDPYSSTLPLLHKPNIQMQQLNQTQQQLTSSSGFQSKIFYPIDHPAANSTLIEQVMRNQSFLQSDSHGIKIRHPGHTQNTPIIQNSKAQTLSAFQITQPQSYSLLKVAPHNLEESRRRDQAPDFSSRQPFQLNIQPVGNAQLNQTFTVLREGAQNYTQTERKAKIQRAASSS